MVFVLFWAFSTPLFSQFLINSLQKKFPPLTLSTLTEGTKADAIVVLGHGVDTAAIALDIDRIAGGASLAPSLWSLPAVATALLRTPA